MPLNVLLSVQGDQQSIQLLRLAGHLPRNIRYGSAELRALDRIEGPELFRLHGCTDLSDSVLQDLSVRLRDLPICIAAAAYQLRECHSWAEREAYCIKLNSVSGPTHQMAEFFEKNPQILTSRHRPPKPHPQAILRLLALMPGATHNQFIHDLVEELRSERLPEFEADANRQFSGPFVVMNRDRIDLHPMARENIMRELDAIVNGRHDDNTDASELARIHLVAARLSFRSLLDVPTVLSLAEMEAIEGVIFHLLKFRDIRKTTGGAYQKKRQARTYKIASKRVKRQQPKLRPSASKKLPKNFSLMEATRWLFFSGNTKPKQKFSGISFLVEPFPTLFHFLSQAIHSPFSQRWQSVSCIPVG